MKINCPHCEQKIEASEEFYGMTVECPECAGEFTIPAPLRTPPQVATVYQPAKAEIVNPDTHDCPYCGGEIPRGARKCKHCATDFSKQADKIEATIWRGTPAKRHILFPVAVRGFIILILCLVAVGSPAAAGFIYFIIVIIAVTVAVSVLKIITTCYEVTNKRINFKTGLIIRQEKSVRLTDIRGININRNLKNFILGTGNIEIGTAATSGVEIVFFNVKNPKKVQSIINQQSEDY
jgi:membrane protein YdbS with pleckstrin-like domain